MPTYRVRRDHEVLAEDDAPSLQDATLRAIEVSADRQRSDRQDYVLDERVGRSWRPRVTIHPPSLW